MTVSIGNSAFADAICLESNTNGSERYGWLYVKLQSPPMYTGTFTVKWNGYVIYSGECTDF